MILQQLRTSPDHPEFDSVIADLLTLGMSAITYEGVNLSVFLAPARNSPTDWIIIVTRERSGDGFDLSDTAQRAHRVLYRHRHFSSRKGYESDKKSAQEYLLESSFAASSQSYAPIDIIVKNSGNSTMPASQNGVSRQNTRFRRHTLMQRSDLRAIDPLINRLVPANPVIPEAEDTVIRNMRKRSSSLNEVNQRARRELEEIEEEVNPLPKVIANNEEGPIFIEDLFRSKNSESALRRKRHHLRSTKKSKRAKMKNKSSKSEFKRHGRSSGLRRAETANILTNFFRQKRNKGNNHLRGTVKRSNKLTQLLSSGSSHRPRRHETGKSSKSANKRKALTIGRETAELADPKTFHKDDKSDVKRKAENINEISSSLDADPGRLRQKHSDPDSDYDEDEDVPSTTEAPDPFADIESASPLVDYYDVSKRQSDNIGDDFDPETSMIAADSPKQEQGSKEAIKDVKARKKRQSFAEKTEDEDAVDDIPSWRQTLELLKRANTFAVPAHDRDGHIILVRRVRDLGILDIGESLAKLKETMAKVFGRCSPVKRRKRSQRRSPELVKDSLENQETWEIQGEKDEMVDEAKIDVRMDDDKPYNMTTILRPMGKRSSGRISRKGQRTKKKSERKKTRKAGKTKRKKISGNKARQTELSKGVKSFEQSLENVGSQKSFLSPRNSHKQKESRRDDYELPLNKLLVNQPFSHSQPTLSAKLSSDKGAQGPLKKRNKTIRALKGQNNNFKLKRCKGCKRAAQSKGKLSRRASNHKLAREPYIITRRYNDSKVRTLRKESNVRKTRELSVNPNPETDRLLYIANDDSMPDTRLMSVKRDVDISAEVKVEVDETSTPLSATTIETTIIEVESEDVFGNDAAEQIIEEKVITPSKESIVPADSSSVVVVDNSRPVISTKTVDLVEAPPPTPLREEEIITTSVVDENGNTGNENVEELIMPESDLDLSLSTSSDRLLGLISDVEKALRVSLGSPRGIAVIDDGSVVHETSPVLVTSSGPVKVPDGIKMELKTGTKPLGASAAVEIESEPVQSTKETIISDSASVPLRVPVPTTVNRYSYGPNPPSRVQTIQYAFPEKQGIDSVNENIYLKGFDPITRPLRPFFVDSTANKMALIKPSYKTVVASKSNPVVKPGYLRVYDNSLPPNEVIEEVDTDILGTQQEIVEKIQQPVVEDVVPSVGVMSPQTFDVHGSIAVNGKLVGEPVPMPDKDTMVKVISSIRSDDSEDKPLNVLSAPVLVETDIDEAPVVEPFPGGHLIAMVGDHEEIIKKKDVGDSASRLDTTFLDTNKRYKLSNSEGAYVKDEKDTKRSILGKNQNQNTKKVYDIPIIRNSYKRTAGGNPAANISTPDGLNSSQETIVTYTQDPGVKTATMAMLTSLANKLALQNLQKNNAQPVKQRSLACTRSISGGCLQRRVPQFSGPHNQYVSPRNMPHRYVPRRAKQTSGRGFGPMHIRRKVKRNVSPSVFEKPKIYFRNPNVIDEALRSKYQISESQNHESDSNNLNTETISKKIISTQILDPIPNTAGKKSEVVGSKLSIVKSNLPAAHEKALKEATKPERFKILDPQDIFYSRNPTFDKKVDSGGHVVVEQKLPLLPASDLGEKSDYVRSKVDETTSRIDIKEHIFDNGHKAGDFVSYVDKGLPYFNNKPITKSKQTTISRALRSVNMNENAPEGRLPREEKIISSKTISRIPIKDERRSSKTQKKQRKVRESNIGALQSVSKNRKQVRSISGLKQPDNKSTAEVRRQKCKRDALCKAKRELADREKEKRKKWLNKMRKRDEKRKKLHQAWRQAREEEAHAAAREKVADILRTEGARDSQTIASAMGPLGGSKQKRGLNGKLVHNEKRRRRTKQFSRENSEKVALKHSKHRRNAEYKSEPHGALETNPDRPSFRINSKVHNDRVVEVANPEHYDLSEGRSREEKVKFSSLSNQPMEVNAVLRGKRRKRYALQNKYAPFRYNQMQRRTLPADAQDIPDAEPIYTTPQDQIPQPIEALDPNRDFRRSSPLFSSGKNPRSMNDAYNPDIQISPTYPRASVPIKEVKPMTGVFAGSPSSQAVAKRDQFFQTNGSPRGLGPTSNIFQQRIPGELERLQKAVAERDTSSNHLLVPKSNRTMEQPMKSLFRKPDKMTHNFPRIESKSAQMITTPQPTTEESVWKKLGEIFDVNRKETASKQATTTSEPYLSSPSPLQEMVPDDASIHATPRLDKGDEHVLQKPGELSPGAKSTEVQNKSGFRAAVVDRLLHDLRKMSSARGSEMARAESDLIEILHDYQTDLMDEEEETIAGEPFQGRKVLYLFEP